MNSKKIKYTVAVVGAGRIAVGFDTPDSREVLTHAHAIAKNSRLKLLGITDTNAEGGKKAAIKWGTKFFPDLKQLLSLHADIIVVATPDSTHAKILQEIYNSVNKPKLVICEKPLVVTKKELKSIRKLTAKPILLVNYSLRFDPLFRKIKKDLSNGIYGKVISAHATYTNGLFHNGSHTIDIARFFFGEMKTCRATFSTNDVAGGTPSMGGVATFERCPQFSLMIGDERSFSASGFEILTERGRLRFINFNYEFSFEEVIPDPNYAGFNALSKPKIIKTERMKAFPNLYKHAVNVLDEVERSISPLDEAIKSQEACFRFFESFKKVI